jgi:hypothetical protein
MLGLGLSGSVNADPSQKTKPPRSNRPEKSELREPEVKRPLDLSNPMPLVEVMINGTGPFVMVIDTSETTTTLDDNVVKTLGLTLPTPDDASKAADENTSAEPTVRLISVAIGEAFFFGVNARVIDVEKATGEERLYDGILGLPIFADVLLTLDYPKETVVITKGALPESDGKTILDYTEKDGLATLPLTIDEAKTKLALASGYGGALSLERSLRPSVKMAPLAYDERPRSRPTDEELSEETHIMGTVELGKYVLFQPTARFLGPGWGPVHLMGHRVLSNFAVTFDQKNRRVQLQRKDAGPVTFGDARPKFGIVFSHFGRYLKVREVFPDTPGSRSPIRVGDKIEWIDGRRPNQFAPGELSAFIEEAQIVTYSINRGGATLHVTLRPWD